MNQSTFINLKAIASTRAIRAARRARELGGISGGGGNAYVVEGAASLVTHLPEHFPEKPHPDRFVGQIELTLHGEDRVFLSPYGMERCQECGAPPLLEKRSGHGAPFSSTYRVRCTNSEHKNHNAAGQLVCTALGTGWHDKQRDAIRVWNFAIKLSQ